MRYKKVKVCGHRRSGTHYVAALISLNFLNDDRYNRIYEKHKTPDKLKINKNKDTLFIYVWRDFDKVAKSIFDMRKRFGLKEDNYEKFLKTRYCDMFDGNQDVKVKVETLTNKKTVSKVGGGLKNVKMTPYQFWKYDLDRGLKEENDNVLTVKYDLLISNFEDKMKEISDYLDPEKTEFQNIDKKIGGTPLN